MTGYTEVFTQGGQTQLHKLRMIQQVIGSTFKAGLWVFLIAFVVLVYKDHIWQELWFLLCYAKAYLRIEHMSFLPYEFFDSSMIVNKNGSVHDVRDAWILRQDHLHTMMLMILLSLMKKLLQSLLIAAVSVIALSWFWVNRGRKGKETKILGGFQLVSPKVLSKLIKKKGASPYDIAGVPIPHNAEFQHLMVTGTTGAGKSNMIHQLLQQIRDQGDQAIVVDTTGGIFSRFYDPKKDLLLNPLDERSEKWNMWEEVINDYVVEEIAESIIPEQGSQDSFWVQSARQVFSESVRFLMRMDQRSYQALIEMTLKIPLKDLRNRLGDTSVSSLVDPSIDKTALSIRATLSNYLRFFQYLDDRGDGLSLLNFVNQNPKQWLFLSCPTDQREFLKPLFSAWMSLIIKGIMRRSEHSPSRTWIIMDEIASLNRIPSLMTGLAEVRKYGGCFVLGFQDLSQIENLYGVSNTKTLSNLTGTKVLFRCVDTDVAARVSRYLGEQEKQETSESISFGAHQMRDGVSLSHQKQTKSLMSSSDIMLLKDLECYLRFPGDFPVTKVRFDYVNFLSKETSFIPRARPVSDSNKSSDSSDGSPHSNTASSGDDVMMHDSKLNDGEPPLEDIVARQVRGF